MWTVQRKSIVPALLLMVVAPSACSDDSSGGGAACDDSHACPEGQYCSDAGVCKAWRDAGLGDGAVGDGSLGDAGGDGSVIGDGGGDGASSDAGACAEGQTPCGTQCCDSGYVCYQDQDCILEQPSCESDGDCQEDSYCDDGVCVPYGLGPRGSFNPDCTRLSIAGLFQPSLQCTWFGPPAGDPYPNHIQVLSTPMVADFDFDEDQSTIHPSIVFMSYDGLDGSSGHYNGAYGVVRILDGATCQQIYNVGTDLNGCNPPAIGDLDGDGRPDIVVHDGNGTVRAYKYDSASDSWGQLFEGHDASNNVVGYGNQSTGWSAPELYDLDDDGLPEILSGGLIYDSDGLLLDSSLGLTDHMYHGAGYPVAADLEGDGVVELATGDGVWKFDGQNERWNVQWSGGPYGGFVAVADFGTYGDDPTLDDRLSLDGVAEIVVIRDGSALVLNEQGRVVFGPVSLPGSSGGGPPTAGDFDGDGLVEFAAAGSDSYTVFDPDCLGLPDFTRCYSLRTDGILWTQDSQDYSSNQTGSSLFDFEGDGRVEAIYADEVFARVYDGRTGEVVFSTWTSSCTWNENPIVADIDGDYNAELVVPSNRNCGTNPRTDKTWSFNHSLAFYETSHRGNPMDPLFRGLRCEQDGDCLSGVCNAGYCRCTTDDECGGAGSGFVCDDPPGPPMSPTPGTGKTCRAEWLGPVNGVRVFHDVLDRWVGSRTIWNQHAYAVTNINEDGTLPRTSQWLQNWSQPGLNNFRQNVQGSADVNSSPDVTAGRGGLAECTSQGHADLTIRVCNRGTEPVASGVPVAFYNQADQSLVCTSATTQTLGPGDCENLSCEWDDPPRPGNEADVLVVVDDDGQGAGETSECIESNNDAVIHDVACSRVE